MAPGISLQYGQDKTCGFITAPHFGQSHPLSASSGTVGNDGVSGTGFVIFLLMFFPFLSVVP